MSLRAWESELTSAVGRIRESVVRQRRIEPPRRGLPPWSVDGTGTGIVVDSRGDLVTNDHVVHGAREIWVRTDRGEELPGEVLGHDRATDLAVVRVPAHGWPAAELADSDRLRVGQFVIAVGNSLGLPGGPSVSVGVVSALGRPLPGADHVLEGLIQTDAAINPGNSGGPLADLDARVVGINTAMIPFAQGVGFAIPANTVRFVVEQLRTGGRVVRPWLGANVVSVDPPLAQRFSLGVDHGVLLAEVHRPSPAADAGLRGGDVLVRVGDRGTASVRELLGTLGALPLGGAVDIEFVRGRGHRRAVLRVTEAPPALQTR